MITFQSLASEKAITVSNQTRPLVCVQGLGFVGAAMSIAVASAKTPEDEPYFNVIGLDLENPLGKERIQKLNEGIFPFETTDEDLIAATRLVHQQGNFLATSNMQAYQLADVTVVDIPLDIDFSNLDSPKMQLESFKKGIQVLGEQMKPGSLIIVETTVPPGTCEHVVAPILEKCLQERQLPKESIQLAHSYERVMPGKDYLHSITHFWRVYSGHTSEAADTCQKFLEKVVNTTDFPLKRLGSTTASETSKVLENSYRATTIAFMEEWGRFSEAVGIDLFEVVDAIRVRPTHNNIRTPGFGVGGYCLTKDPLFPEIAANEFYQRTDLEFQFCRQAVATNQKMPLVSLQKLKDAMGTLEGKTVLLMGVSYRQDVGDTRYSPSEPFVLAAEQHGAHVICHDPLVTEWPEFPDKTIHKDIPPASHIDAVVLAVPHHEYQTFQPRDWFPNFQGVVLDSGNILSQEQQSAFKQQHANLIFIGKGEQS